MNSDNKNHTKMRKDSKDQRLYWYGHIRKIGNNKDVKKVTMYIYQSRMRETKKQLGGSGSKTYEEPKRVEEKNRRSKDKQSAGIGQEWKNVVKFTLTTVKNKISTFYNCKQQIVIINTLGSAPSHHKKN